MGRSLVKGLLSLVIGVVVIAGGMLVIIPLVFAGRVLPGVVVGEKSITGISFNDLPKIVDEYGVKIGQRSVSVTLRGQTERYLLADLGVGLKKQELLRRMQDVSMFDILMGGRVLAPVAQIDENVLAEKIAHDFTDVINLPTNASLKLSGTGNLELVKSKPGEEVEMDKMTKDLEELVAQQKWDGLVTLVVRQQEAAVQDNEVEEAKKFASSLLSEGFSLVYDNQTLVMKPYTVSRMLVFVEQVDPSNFNNRVLGVKFDSAKLLDYLNTTITPEVNREAVNARFELEGEGSAEKVKQFAMPQSGQALDVPKTVGYIASSLAKRQAVANLAIDIVEPDISGLNDITELGVTALLAVGESDFSGSPNNRRHNIAVGADRYHGVLIPPHSEFSFNHYLGPVTAAAGFKPELVIKNNVTTPEFGGGLCQVSTTLFRAALNAGLEVTERRNHAYVVRYYGQPGLDATIYPPYTDLRFLNNTPGYILIQAKIEGSKLSFQLWGTADGRQVDINGPVVYDRQPDGAVKAYVEQKVSIAGQEIVEDVFYSRYKSPKLFPRAASNQ